MITHPLHLASSSPFISSHSASHRHLHSFPTRRSSDLSTILLLNFIKLSPNKKANYPLYYTICPSFKYFWTKDRKSTRLNSSHVAISYAVFCLKKKTYRNQEYEIERH